jgi:NAD(P)-dependent dehydrogenase (short-subunit alcohol dehydrogenase family)
VEGHPPQHAEARRHRDPDHSAPVTSDEASSAANETFAEASPLCRIGRTEELANGAYFVASDEGSCVNRIDLQVGGGLAQV